MDENENSQAHQKDKDSEFLFKLFHVEQVECDRKFCIFKNMYY